MSALDATYLVYAAVAVPLVVGAAWSLYRHSAPLWFDLLDTDEMVVAAIHRLCTAGFALLCGWLAVAMAPSAEDVRQGALSAVLSAVAGLLVLLAGAHLGLVALYVRSKRRRTERTFAPPAFRTGPLVDPVRPVLIPGATPPTVPMGPPIFHAPRAAVPPGVPIDAATWAYPPPSGPRLAPAVEPPYPPPWCTPLPNTFDAWAPPRR